MDPDANLKEQREILRRLDGATDEVEVQEDCVRLGELVEALDEWLSNGGFLPAAWATKRQVFIVSRTGSYRFNAINSVHATLDGAHEAVLKLITEDDQPSRWSCTSKPTDRVQTYTCKYPREDETITIEMSEVVS